MNLLGFDTATDLTVVCVAANDYYFESDPIDAGAETRPQHSSQLLLKIFKVLKDAGLRLEDIDQLAVSVGPGTYTGLRIGVATARALAQSLELTVRPISTLEVVALGVAEKYEEVDLILPVVDAKRSEVFTSAYRCDRGAEGLSLIKMTEPYVSTAAEITEGLGNLEPGCFTAAGNGAVKYLAELKKVGLKTLDSNDSAHMPAGRNICRAAMGSSPVGFDQIVPFYLRLPDAELTLREGKLNV